MLTVERLRELLHYDPETGVFTRLVRAGPSLPGAVAGCVRPDGYNTVRLDKKQYYGQRLAFLYMTGTWPLGDVDHKNGIAGDDRWENLRAANRSQNLGNSNLRKDNTSGFKGVYWLERDKIWRAQICVNQKRRALGDFRTREAAHAAYREAAEVAFGEFARTGQ